MVHGIFWWSWGWPFSILGKLAEIVLGIAVLVFWIFMIIDCAQRNFRRKNEKIFWIIVLILVQWVGAVIYYFVVKEYYQKGIWKRRNKKF